MKITIDTQHDTYEDIRKVMHLLSGIIERKELSGANNSNSSATSTDTANLMSMFDASASQKDIADTPPDFSSFLNLTNNRSLEKKDPKPRVELY